MKLKIEQLLEKRDALTKVLSKDLPFKTSYRLSKLASQIQQEMKHVENTRNEMIRKFGEKAKDGTFKVANEKVDEFRIAWEDFIKEEIELNIEKTPYELFERIELSAFDVANIEDFINGESVQEKS